jgi:hypothetical protein
VADGAGAGERALGELNGTSSNTGGVDLLPDAAIAGSGAARMLNLTTLPNASGQATMSMTVSDGAQTTTRSFLLTVLPVRSYYLAEGSTGGFFSTPLQHRHHR